MGADNTYGETYFNPGKPEDRRPETGESLRQSEIRRQMELDEEEDQMWDQVGDFDPCGECELPDACQDFGCAIEVYLGQFNDLKQ
jgi:hypothetical protein